jgi:hypothetical protein
MRSLVKYITFGLPIIVRNIFDLLAQREISPRTKHQAKKLWSKSPGNDADSNELRYAATDAKHDIYSWYGVLLYQDGLSTICHVCSND